MIRTLRDKVWQRANSACKYCQLPQVFMESTHEVDHIIAEKHRGKSSETNLALACFPCNNHKGSNISGVDPLTEAMTRLYHPRVDIWSEHFRWEGPELIGLTAIGRTTVEVLGINLPKRVALRQSFIEEGGFPS